MRPRIYLLFKLPLNASIPLAIFQTQTLSTCKAAVLSSAGHILKRKVAMPINAKCRTPSVTCQNCSNPGLVRTSARRYSIYNLVQSSISFYYEDKFVTTCNVTFYLKQNLNRLSYSLTYSKYL